MEKNRTGGIKKLGAHKRLCLAEARFQRVFVVMLISWGIDGAAFRS